MTYQIKGLKTFRGHEGEPCAQGTLHGPAGKVADWSDDSWGGPLQLDFVNKGEQDLFVAFARGYLADKKDYEGKPYDLSTMNDWAIAETAVTAMSVQAQEDKELAKHAKKGLAYYLPDKSEPDGRALYVSKAAYTPENVAKLRAKHPDLLEIVNERLGLPFVDGKAHEQALRMKRWQRDCKKYIIFTLKDPSGEVKEMVCKTPYTAAHAATLRTRHPNLVEIVNERFL